ncbi:MAG: TonB-dependent receptor [Pseudomonadota bacterium]
MSEFIDCASQLFVDVRSRRAAAWRVSLAVAAAIAAVQPTLVLAEDAATDTTELSEVVVTGSRIIREGMSSPTPVTSLSTTELLQANPQSLSQALATLPSMTGSTTPKTMGGRTTLGVGTFLNLRNLGTNRNLVLLDGRRLVPANIAGNTDINLIPQNLITSVNVVTGGASAAYGSDAVAGVTNFILDTHFEGFKADVSGGLSAHDGDAGYYRVALAGGGELMDGRLHLIGSFDWRNSQQAYKENRGWASQYCAIVPIPGVTTGNMSPTNPRQTLACGVTQPGSSYGGAITAGPLVTPTQGITFGPGSVPEAYTYGTLKSANLQVGGEGNFIGDTANFSTPTDNKVYFGRGAFDINENLEAFIQGTVASADSVYTQTPAYFQSPTALTIFSGNPFIPASIQQRMTTLNTPSFGLGLVPKSWGTIDVDSGYESWDGVAGIKGKFGDGWTWETYYQQGRTSFRLDYINGISLERAFRAADTVQAPNGTFVCQSAIANPAAYGNCVPLNVLGEGSPSQAALDYIHGDAQAWNLNVMHQKSAAANINGDLFATWAGPIGVGAGVEWRELEGEVQSDAVSNTVPNYTGIRGLPSAYIGRVGGWLTSNVLPAAGKYNVTEGFVEVLAPLAKDLFLARSLDLNAAFRITDYSQSGTVDTWKLGMTWRPIDDLLFRVARSRDIRAPGIGDLYSRDSQGPQTIVNATTIGGSSSANVAVIISGNPNLKPEEADTTTFGLTYQPAWLTGFSASVDYYDIKIKDVLASVGAQETVNRCGLGQQLFCDNLVISSGTLIAVRSPTLNLSQARTTGVDLDFAYHTNISSAKTTFRLIGTRLLEQSTTVPNATGASYIDRVGDASLGYAEWIVNGNVNVDVGAMSFNANARFIDGGLYNTTYLPGDLDPAFTKVKSTFTVDLGARYRLESSHGSPELYLNVANVFDTDPPLIPSSALVGGQTNVSLYDTLGRFYTAGVRLQF